MLQKLFVSYQLCTDPLRKEWLLAAPALQRPSITKPKCCAKDQTVAGDTRPPQGLHWARPSLRVGCHPSKGACTHASPEPSRAADLLMGRGVGAAERTWVSGRPSERQRWREQGVKSIVLLHILQQYCGLFCTEPAVGLWSGHWAGVMRGAGREGAATNAACASQGRTGCVDEGGALAEPTCPSSSTGAGEWVPSTEQRCCARQLLWRGALRRHGVGGGSRRREGGCCVMKARP